MTHSPVPQPPGPAVGTEPPAAPGQVASGRTIVGAVGVQLLARLVGTVASIVTLGITTRYLGVHDYGLLTTAIVFVGVWTSLTELGIGAVIVRRVTGGQGDLSELVGLNLGLSLVYCLPLAVVSAATGLAVYHDRGEVHGVLVVVCLSLVPTALSSCFNPVFMAHMRFGTVAVTDVACRLASLAATVVVVAADGGLVWFGAVQIVPPLVQLVGLGWRASRIVPLRLRFDRGATWSLVRESIPQTAVLIVGVLYWRADAVILTLFGSVRDVGAYGLAYTVAFTTSVLSTFFLSSSLSSATAAFAHDRGRFVRLVSSGTEVMLFAGLPIAVIGGILARPVVTLLADDEYAASASTPMTILLVAVALTFLTAALSQALFAAHEQVFLLRLNIVNLVLNIALNLVLVPMYGAVGAAAALVASEVPGLVITSWRLRRRHDCRPPWRFLAHLCVPLAAAAGVALAAHGLPVLIALALASATYLVVNLVVGPVRLATARALTSAGS